jgi:hypothetical protein
MSASTQHVLDVERGATEVLYTIHRIRQELRATLRASRPTSGVP